MGVEITQEYLKSMKYLFTKEGAQSVGGFGTIAGIFPAQWNWLAFWSMTAFLSIILGVMNLLPIPALDGGHVMFLLYEVVSGRKPNDKFLEYAQMTGMILLLALLVYANGMDVIRAVFK
jgi:regulator of sigma E protease